MKKYRIIKETKYKTPDVYRCQKRFLGLLWWNNVPNYWFYDLEQARERINELRFKEIRMVIDEYEDK